jgi:hypothetical protein
MHPKALNRTENQDIFFVPLGYASIAQLHPVVTAQWFKPQLWAQVFDLCTDTRRAVSRPKHRVTILQEHAPQRQE